MPKTFAVWLLAGVLSAFSTTWPVLASDICDAKSKVVDVCLCTLSELHPKQSAFGATEVRRRVDKLSEEIQNRSNQDFFNHLRKQHSRRPWRRFSI